MRRLKHRIGISGGLWAAVLLALALSPGQAAAFLADSERQRLSLLAEEWGSVAQVEGPVAADPRDRTQPTGSIERALAGAAMGDAVLNIAARSPEQFADAIVTAVTLAPALADPIVARISDEFPDQAANIAALASAALEEQAPVEAEAESVAEAPASGEAESAPPAEAAPVQIAETSDEPEQFAEIEAALYEDDENDGEAAELNDPYEGVNRFIFAINDMIDTVVFRPLAALYGFVTPSEVKLAVRKFYRNLNEPVVFANKLLQFEGEEALITLGRFAVNSTAGGAGFFEVADDWGLPRQTADFGQTMHGWGVPRGNYLIIPVIGPSNTRYGAGRVVDIALNPRTWLLSMPANGGLTAGFALSLREQLLQPLDQLRTGSIDYYTAIKSVYWQNRLRTLRGEQSGDEFTLGDENLDADFDAME